MNLRNRTISVVDARLLEEHHPAMLTTIVKLGGHVLPEDSEAEPDLTLEDLGLERFRPEKAPWETPLLTHFIDGPIEHEDLDDDGG